MRDMDRFVSTVLATIKSVRDQLETQIRAIPVVHGRDGQPGVPGRDGVKGDIGERGVMGEPGPVGPQGPVGERGEQGETGAAGRDGTDGLHGKDGQDGRDGSLLEKLQVVPVSERIFDICFEDGTPLKGGRLKFAVPLYRDSYQAEIAYEKGDAVTDDSSLWIATVDGTTDRPGTSADWKLAVKRGREGKSGPQGLKGGDGKPGRDGRDYYK